MLAATLAATSRVEATDGAALAFQISASGDTIQLTLTNISEQSLKVLPWFNWGTELNPNSQVVFEIQDDKGHRADLDAHYYDARSAADDWIKLGPRRFVGITIATEILGRDYGLRKERYSIRAIYHQPYYSPDGKKHDIRAISNTITFVSKTDIKADFCAGHFPDGRSVPRRLIIQQCSGRRLTPFEVEATCAASGGCSDK